MYFAFWSCRTDAPSRPEPTELRSMDLGYSMKEGQRTIQAFNEASLAPLVLL